MVLGCNGSGGSGTLNDSAGGSAGISGAQSMLGGSSGQTGQFPSGSSSGGVPGGPASGGTPALGVGGVAVSGGSPALGGTGNIGAGAGSGVIGGGGTSTGGTTTSAAGGAAAGASGSSAGGTSSNPASCGGPLAPHPFGCAFGWGTNNPSGNSLDGYDYLSFMSNWVGYEVTKDGTLPSCGGCTWLMNEVSKTALIPVYYAYFIGYYGHANGLPDGNQNPNGPNLTTGGANLIRTNRARIVDMYGSYADKTYQAWPTKPLVWLLEGDFVQYSATSQMNPLSYTELAQLTADITCAIKSKMPNAVVAVNHSTWNADDVTNAFWGAMKAESVAYDLAWTTGVANNAGFFDASENGTTYNHSTATYAYLHTLTGRPILVDTSFGLSAMGDTWSNATSATVNARIGDGVIAANVATVPSNYSTAVKALAPSLTSVCK